MTAVSHEDPPGTKRPVLELIRLPAYWRWAAATTVLRLPSLMFPMAMVLISMHYTGSPALGGLVVAASMAPTVVAAPLAGRLLDRLGTAKWTPRLLAIGGVGRLVVAAGFVLDLHAVVLVALAFASATATCGISGATRTLLLNSVPKRLVGAALSLDAVSAEIVGISAPFLVALAALAGPIYSLVAIGVAGVLAGLLLASRAVRQQEAASKDEVVSQGAGPAAAGRRWGLLRNREFLFWVLVTAAVGQVMGTTDLGALPVAVAHGGGAVQAALLLSVLGAASAGAGLLYAWYGKSIRLGFVTQACVLLVLMIASLLLIASGTVWLGLIFTFGVLGLWVTPISTVMQEAPGTIIPATRMTEAFNILVAAGVLGFAMVGGLLSVLPFRVVLFLGPVLPVVALLSAPFLLRNRPPATGAEAEPEVAPVSGAAR